MSFNQLLPLHKGAVPVGHSAVLSSDQVCLQAGGCCELVHQLTSLHLSTPTHVGLHSCMLSIVWMHMWMGPTGMSSAVYTQHDVRPQLEVNDPAMHLTHCGTCFVLKPYQSLVCCNCCHAGSCRRHAGLSRCTVNAYQFECIHHMYSAGHRSTCHAEPLRAET